MAGKLCCKYQELIWECIYKQEFQEYWKSMEGWFRTGKLGKNGEVKFDCANCSEFYTWIINSTGIDTNSKEINLVKIKEVGCCLSISVIKNLDDEVDIERLKVWLEIFKENMCGDCSEIVKEFLIERRLSS